MDAVIESLNVLGGRYEVGELLGRGGMAEVHRGRDLRLDRNVAIKLLRPELGADPEFRSRFRQEAQSAARMSHPTVVRVFDAGEEPAVDAHGRTVTVPYIVMEYVDGRMVKDIIAEGPLSAAEAVRITNGILTALEYSHRAGVIHRDIKPGNIMVTPGGGIKVMDFGIARAVSETSTTVAQTGTILGTAQYFSPEQARGEHVDSRTDLYAMGVVLFEMLTGQPPFRGETPVAVAYQHVSEPAAAPSTVREGVSPAMDSVVLKSLAKRREDRFQTAVEFREALEQALQGVAVADNADDATTVFAASSAPGPATTMLQALDSDDYQPAPQRRPPVAWIWGGIGIIGVLVFAIVFWASSQGVALPIAGLSTNIPNVAGNTQEDAIAELEELGLDVAVREVESDLDPGTVMSTDPPAETLVAPNATVTLIVSSGPPPSALVNVQGNTVAQATNALESARLTVGSQIDTDHPALPAGTVIGTDPAAGTEVSVGQTVNLLISSGNVTIPDVVGLSMQEAEALLEGSEVQYSVVRYIRFGCYDGSVVAQSLVGTQPQQGSINVTYCGDSRPAPPPPPSTPAPSAPAPSAPTPPDEGNGNGNGNGNG